jgi:polyisoprenoid-binding protein YceI
MKMISLLASLLLSVSVFAKAAPELNPYQVETSHASLDFAIKHMMISNVKGSFKKWNGEFMFDKATGTLDNVKINVETASIFTNDEKRDEHLKNEDFFNVSKFPSMSFVSKKVVMKGKKPSKLEGELTLVGVTKPVVVDIEFLGSTTSFQGTEILAFKGKTKINRKDFGMTWNKALDKGGFAIGETVDVAFEFESVPVNKK